MTASTFRPPAHVWHASMFGIAVSPTVVLDAGKEITIVCQTLCGKERATGTYVIQQRMSVSEAARRAQFAASIQHVTRRACLACRDLYQHGTTPYERQYLVATHPELGPIVGLAVCGEYGVPLAPVNPEDIGITDPDQLAAARRQADAAQQAMRDRIKAKQRSR